MHLSSKNISDILQERIDYSKIKDWWIKLESDEKLEYLHYVFEDEIDYFFGMTRRYIDVNGLSDFFYCIYEEYEWTDYLDRSGEFSKINWIRGHGDDDDFYYFKEYAPGILYYLIQKFPHWLDKVFPRPYLSDIPPNIIVKAVISRISFINIWKKE